MSGEISRDIWENGLGQVTDSTPCMIVLAVVGGICITAYLSGVVVSHVRSTNARRHIRPVEPFTDSSNCNLTQRDQ